MCHKVLARLGRQDNPLFELALRLEEIALKDDYFIGRKLYPNVDFYSGIIYSALGIPRSMFTVMFAIARTAGWVAHWQEMIGDPQMKIGRPRQLYTGPVQRDYVEVEKRDAPGRRFAVILRSLGDSLAVRSITANLRPGTGPLSPPEAARDGPASAR